jgi:hypothetical protein
MSLIYQDFNYKIVLKIKKKSYLYLYLTLWIFRISVRLCITGFSSSPLVWIFGFLTLYPMMFNQKIFSW